MVSRPLRKGDWIIYIGHNENCKPGIVCRYSNDPTIMGVKGKVSSMRDGRIQVEDSNINAFRSHVRRLQPNEIPTIEGSSK